MPRGRTIAPYRIHSPETRRIRAALKRAEVTQSALADEIGVSRQAVNNILQGRTSSKRISALIRAVVKGWEDPPPDLP